MSKKDFRNRKAQNQKLRIITKHNSGKYGNAQESKNNKKHNSSYINNIINEDLEEEYINNH